MPVNLVANEILKRFLLLTPFAISILIRLKKKKMSNLCLEKQIISRQYSDKWKFPDYNALLKKMQCNQVLSFCNYPVQTDVHNYDVPISTCKFSNKHKDVLAVANENGVVCIQNVKKANDRKFIQTHKNTVYDIAWMPENSQFITVSGDNSAKLWDCEGSNVRLISIFRGHKRSVRCVSFKPENTSVFATGSRDGSLMIWDTRAQKKCASFSHHLPDQIIPSGAGSSPIGTKWGTRKPNFSIELLNCKSVTGLVFQNDNTLISCGSLDNFIRVWDMRKTYSRSASNSVAKYQLCSPYSGFSYLCTNTTRTKLYANCMDSYIYCFNINSYHTEPVAAFYGHENGSFYVKSSINFDGNYLMSGSSDECAYIWNTRGAELSEVAVKPFVTLRSHLAEVTCIEMCPDNMVIVTCSDDGTFRLWNSLAVDQDSERRVDRAACYDVENVSTVKTQWKNKRKCENLEDYDAKQLKSDNSSPHSKICRFYTKNLSSSCICHAKCTHKSGLKRLNEESLVEINSAKRKYFFAAQENTPPKHEKSINLSAAEVIGSIAPTKHVPPPLRLSSKRKLEDMPSFLEESNKNKKINCSRILVSVNAERANNGSKSVCHEVEVVKKCQNQTPSEITSQIDNCLCDLESKEISLGIPSPTFNLPNYIEDGTSPYIHRCPKINHRENDWLTKLQEAHKTAKTPEQKKVNSDILTRLEHKKKVKHNDHTLHKYFKVSSKTTEKNFNSTEFQKKSILIK